jgi:hypothetical protein
VTCTNLHFRVAPWMPFMALRCNGRDPRTQEVRALPAPGYTLRWAVTFPISGEQLRTQFTDPALEFDQQTGFYVYRLTDDQLVEVLEARQPVSLVINMETPAGTVVPWATGFVSGEQLP